VDFSPDLFLGMFSPLIDAIPKPHSDKLCLINNHSASMYSLNSWIKKEDGSVQLDNLQDFGTLLQAAWMHQGRPPSYIFKSDVSQAFCHWPMHLLWQIKQVVSIDGMWHMDHCMVFGSRSSLCIWYTFMGLIIWIAIMYEVCMTFYTTWTTHSGKNIITP